MIRIVGALLLTLPACALSDDAALQELGDLMQGRFDTHAPGRQTELPDESRLVDSRQRIASPHIDGLAFYLQLNQREDLELYRQRILVFRMDGENIVQKAYTLNDAPRFVDAVSGDALLDELTMDDMAPMFQEGCGQVWTKTASGFRGYTDPATCRIISSRTGKPRRIESEALLDTDSLSLVERGYDDDMNQLFGSPQGEFIRLYRRD